MIETTDRAYVAGVLLNITRIFRYRNDPDNGGLYRPPFDFIFQTRGEDPERYYLFRDSSDFMAGVGRGFTYAGKLSLFEGNAYHLRLYAKNLIQEAYDAERRGAILSDTPQDQA